MTTQDPRSTPIARSTFASADEAEITDLIGQMYADNSTRFTPTNRSARFSVHSHDATGIGADRIRSSLNYTGTSAEGFSDFVAILVNAGTVDITSRHASALARPGDVISYPIGTPLDFTVHDVDITVVRLPAAHLRTCAQEVTGLPTDQLRFHALTPVTPATSRYWTVLTKMVAGALGDPDSPLTSPLLAQQMARTTAITALHTFPNTTMDSHNTPGPGNVGPAALRRALAYLEAHAEQPITVTDIAAAAGTSARALQYAFRRHLDTTPLAHLRRVRLERARRELQAGDPTRGVTVAAVATRWGFTNSGRLAAAYRQAFGETPRQTLQH